MVDIYGGICIYIYIYIVIYPSRHTEVFNVPGGRGKG